MLFLYGPPGVGKSTIAKVLAEKLGGVPCIDLDFLIEENHGSINKMIGNGEEAHFREIESNILLGITESPETKNAIVSLGGGALLRRENLGFINAVRGSVILLTGSYDILYERILADTKNTRPLIPNRETFMAIMRERTAHYAEFDQQIIVDHKTPEQVVQEIQSKYNLLMPTTPSLVPRSPSVSARSLVDRST